MRIYSKVSFLLVLYWSYSFSPSLHNQYKVSECVESRKQWVHPHLYTAFPGHGATECLSLEGTSRDCPAQSPTPSTMLRVTGVEYLRRWRLDKASGQSVPDFESFNTKKNFPLTFMWNCAHHSFTGSQCLALFIFPPPSGVYAHGYNQVKIRRHF